MMARRSLLGVMATTPLTGVLGGCGRSESFRNKLTLAVDTPDGVKSAFTVVEAVMSGVSVPARGIMTKTYGEALYLDLGPGNRPLIALLTKRFDPGAARKRNSWGQGTPEPEFLAELYGDRQPANDMLDRVSRFPKYRRGPHNISTADLPDLVTFADIKDPKTVLAVDPNNLPSTLGQGVSWRSMTIEITDDPVTIGIEARLPWLSAYFDKMLDGHKPGQRGDGSLASDMNTTFFQRKGF